jgi:hypothetical protein
LAFKHHEASQLQTDKLIQIKVAAAAIHEVDGVWRLPT